MPFERKDLVLKKTRDRWRNEESQESLALKKRKKGRREEVYSREKGKEMQYKGAEHELLGEDTMFLELSATWPSSGAASRFS